MCWKMQVVLQNSIGGWHVTIHFVIILVQFHDAASGLCVIELPAMLLIQAKHTSGSPSPAANSAACHEDARVKRHGGTHARGGGQGESGCDDQPEGLGEWHEAALGD